MLTNGIRFIKHYLYFKQGCRMFKNLSIQRKLIFDTFVFNLYLLKYLAC